MVRTPNYYVQKLYGHHAGTHVLPLTWNNRPLTGQEGLYASSVIDKNKKEIIIKLSNVSDDMREINISLEGVEKKMQLHQNVEVITLAAELEAENSLDKPAVVLPQSGYQSMLGNRLQLTVKPNSFNVVIIDYSN